MRIHKLEGFEEMFVIVVTLWLGNVLEELIISVLLRHLKLLKYPKK